MIRRLASAGAMAVVLVALTGCGQADSGQAPSGNAAPAQGRGQPSPPAAAVDQGGSVEMVAEIKAPEGWTRSTSGGWVVWTSTDKRAKLALSSLDDVKLAE